MCYKGVTGSRVTEHSSVKTPTCLKEVEALFVRQEINGFFQAQRQNEDFYPLAWVSAPTGFLY